MYLYIYRCVCPAPTRSAAENVTRGKRNMRTASAPRMVAARQPRAGRATTARSATAADSARNANSLVCITRLDVLNEYERVRVDRVRSGGRCRCAARVAARTAWGLRAVQRQVGCYARIASRAPRPTGWVWDKRVCIYKYIYTV